MSTSRPPYDPHTDDWASAIDAWIAQTPPPPVAQPHPVPVAGPAPAATAAPEPSVAPPPAAIHPPAQLAEQAAPPDPSPEKAAPLEPPPATAAAADEPAPTPFDNDALYASLFSEDSEPPPPVRPQAPARPARAKPARPVARQPVAVPTPEEVYLDLSPDPSIVAPRVERASPAAPPERRKPLRPVAWRPIVVPGPEEVYLDLSPDPSMVAPPVARTPTPPTAGAEPSPREAPADAAPEAHAEANAASAQLAEAEAVPGDFAEAEAAPGDLADADAAPPEPPSELDELGRGQAGIAAAWLTTDALARATPRDRARALVLAAQLWARAGDAEHARALVSHARALAPSLPLVARAARASARADDDHDAELASLALERARGATPAVRRHADRLARDLARLRGTRAATEAAASSSDEPDARARIDAAAASIAAARELPAAPGSDLVAAMRSAMGDAGRLEALLADRPLPALDWLRVAVLAADPSHAPLAAALAATLASSTDADAVARHLALCLAVDAADAPRVRFAIASLSDDGLAPDEALAAAVAGGVAARDLDDLLAEVRRSTPSSPLPDAIAAAQGALPSTPPATPPQIAALVGRLFARVAPREALDAHLATLVEAVPSLAWLRASLALRQGPAEVAAHLAALAVTEPSRDLSVASALAFEAAGDASAAAGAWARARHRDADYEPALRAALLHGTTEERATVLRVAAEQAPGVRGALLALEAALVAGASTASGAALLRSAHARAPELPIAAWVGERAARALGDAEAELAWLRDRRDAAPDALEAALDLVREARFTGERAVTAQLLERASRARPEDVALREAYELSAADEPADWGAWREARALADAPALRARHAIEAALAAERAGDLPRAERLAAIAIAAGEPALGGACAERLEVAGGTANELTERLLHETRDAADPRTRREAFERLADLDELARADNASAALWHGSIVELEPTFLPSLQRLEQHLAAEGRDEELEALATTLSSLLTGGEARAHAELALRLRRRLGLGERHDLVQVALREAPPPLWALREGVRVPELAGWATQALAARAHRPLEVATLALRAAEVALGTGETATARVWLDRAAAAVPAHPVVARLRAELADAASDAGTAAAGWTAVASTSRRIDVRIDAHERARDALVARLAEAPLDRDALTELAHALDALGDAQARDEAIDRAADAARRAIAQGQVDDAPFRVLSCVAELCERPDAARLVDLAADAVAGRPADCAGLGTFACDPALDERLAPPAWAPSLRSLFATHGAALDLAFPVDPSALAATPLADDALASEVFELGAAFGLAGIECFVSATLGPHVVPLGSSPPRLALGASLAAAADAGSRRFALLHALALVRAGASAVARAHDAEAGALVVERLADLARGAEGLDEARAQLAAVTPEALRDALTAWADRVALLATGQLADGLLCAVRASGHALAPSGAARATALSSCARARELTLFATSSAYADLRAAAGAVA